MNTRAVGQALIFLSLFAIPLRSAQPDPEPVIVEFEAKDKPKPIEKDKKLTEPPKTDVFNLPPLMGSAEFATGFNPQMMGDLQGSFTPRTITITGTKTTTTTVTVPGFEGQPPKVITTQTTVPTSRTITILVPTPGAGSFKISENESPRPVDRVFFTWNYYSNITDPQGAPVSPIDTTQLAFKRILDGSTATQVDTSIPGLPRATANLHREVFGFEKTFLDGYASIELRVPLIQQTSNIEGFSARSIADLTIVGKYAFYLNRETGDVFSGGLAVTLPTGPDIPLGEESMHSTYLQPWMGYIWNSDRFFLQAFHSVVVPTDARDVTLLFNDVGFNYWLYRADRNRALNFIVPMFETHVTTPLNHRNGDGPIFVPDIVVLTTGVHFGLFGNGTLSLGIATPVSGPRPFSAEGFMQLNWRF